MKNSGVPKRNSSRKLGIIFLTVPLAVMIVVLFLYAIINTMLAPGVGSTRSPMLALTIANFILSTLGLISVIALIIGIPTGIYFLVRNEEVTGSFDERSGKGAYSEVPEEIKGWNWGAAGLPLIWGLSHRVWLCLLNFVPFASMFFWIVMGINGNEWAWRASKWKSVEEFKATQNKWKPWGIVFLCLSLIPILFVMISIWIAFMFGANQEFMKGFNSGLNRGMNKPAITYNRNKTIVGAKIKYQISYDPNKWQLDEEYEPEDISEEYSFEHANGSAYAIVIQERVEITMAKMEELAVENAKEVAPDLEVTFKETKIINGKEFLVLKMKGTIDGVKFVYYSYNYSGTEGTIQFITYTTQNIFAEYEKDMKELLDGIKI